VTDTQPNDGITRATGSWTLEEAAELTRAVATTSKKMCGKEYKTDWVAIAALVPGRTRRQCRDRWNDVLDTSIDRANGRTGQWAEDEDSKLRDAVQRHGGKNWGAITALVPGRTKKQCCKRWHLSNGRTGKWTEDEDIKLKNAVRTHGGKDWDAISALVPGRARSQCRSRWHEVLDPSIDRANGRTGQWTAVKDSKLKDAVQTHGGKDWGAISALVPGRAESQCRSRWHNILNPSIGRGNGRKGKWTEGEDSKLKDAAQTHGGKNWAAISALVSGRTKTQCYYRWRTTLDPNIDRGSE
jgi:myb proto-oncogene protein